MWKGPHIFVYLPPSSIQGKVDKVSIEDKYSVGGKSGSRVGQMRSAGGWAASEIIRGT